MFISNNIFLCNISSAKPSFRQVRPYSSNVLCLSQQNKDSISFSGKQIKLPNQNSYNITKAVQKAIEKNEVLGWGSEGKVYKIPDTNYCVKIPNDETEFWGWTNNISLQEKLNHVVAKSDNGAIIMNFIAGKSLPVTNKPDELYTLPIKSYRDFLAQLTNAHNAGLDCDTAPSNTIFNPKIKSLTQIDFRVYQDNIPQPNRHLVNAFCLLQQLPADNKIAKEQNKNLFLNLTQATLEELNLDNGTLINPKDIDFESFYEKYQRMQNGNELPPQYNILNKIMNEAVKLKYRYSIYFNSEYKKLLTSKINYAQSLINQLRKNETKIPLIQHQQDLLFELFD